MRPIGALILTLVVAASFAACGGQSPDAAGPVDPRAVATSAQPVVALKDRWTLDAAESTLVSACMKRADFEYYPTTVQELEQLQAEKPRPYGPASREELAREVRGERVPGRYKPESIRRTNEFVASLRAERERAYDTRLDGMEPHFGDEEPERDKDAEEVELPNGVNVTVPSRGCRVEAQKALYGDPVRWTRAAGIARWVEFSASDEARATSEYRDALDDYMECAADRSVSGKDPYESAFQVVYSGTKEIEPAIDAIWECQGRAALQKVGERAERELARTKAAEHESEILTYRKLATAALTKAREILAE